jgi:hypothetical protein
MGLNNSNTVQYFSSTGTLCPSCRGLRNATSLHHYQNKGSVEVTVGLVFVEQLQLVGKLQYTHYANLNMVECCEFPLLSQTAKTSKRKLYLFAVIIIRAIWLNIVYHLEFFQTHDPV